MSLLDGVLSLIKIKVKDVYIPLSQVSSISSSQEITREVLYLLDGIGFSRIPVFKEHDKQCILGYLLVKRLIKYDLTVPIPVSSLPLDMPEVIRLVE